MSETKSISRLNTLIVLEVLKKHSSFEQPITNTQVLNYAQIELAHMGMYEEKKKGAADANTDKSTSRQLSTSTVGRILDSLAELCAYYPSFTRLINGTVCIRLASNVPGRDGYITYDPSKDDPEEENYNPNHSLKGKTRFYCFSPLFTTEEINIIATSVAANPFLSLEQNQTLNEKILGLFPVQLSQTGATRNTLLPRTINKENEHIKTEKLLDNLTTLLSYIRANHRIRINYGKYDLESHCLISRHNNEFTELEPITITWSNGYAYLLALIVRDYSKQDLSSEIFHYRIDRIIEVRPVLDDYYQPVSCSLLKNLSTSLDILEYQKQHPVMYGGKKQTITFLAKDSKTLPLANLLVDTFGLEYHVKKAGDSDTIYFGELYAEEPDCWYRVSVRATALGTELWAMQHADRVRIISPDSVVEDMKKRFEMAMKLQAL